jgi:aspartate kinase
MSAVVVKFGGTSLASLPDFHAIAANLCEREEQLVVVVSAQAGVTDGLMETMKALTRRPPVHALDALLCTGEQQSAAMMAAALTASGRRAEVVPPWLLFETDGDFGNAEIGEWDMAPVHERLRNHIVPVVAGFTGRAPDGRLCTLGRGGSDYTAVVLGAALDARVELHKAGTDGVYDRDPNLDAAARRFDTLTHAEAFSLAADGAKVLHDKAAKLAMDRRVSIWVRGTLALGPGTRVVPVDDQPLPAVAPSSDAPKT